MNVRILSLAVVLSAAGFQSSSAQTSQNQNTLRNFRLSVNAVAGNDIRVRGAVWTDGSTTNVMIVDQQTPFEFDTFGSVIDGILSVDGREAIRVQVMDEATGRITLAAVGNAIVVGQGLTENPEWAFIKTAR